MCGIVGYIGQNVAARFLVEGLERLEYRGYDSAGLAILEDNAQQLQVIKHRGKVAVTAAAVAEQRPLGKIGIAHTRWATHGEPSDRNAHPHVDCHGSIAVVHNGQLPNHQSLRQQLMAEGHTFRSDTDTEVIAHLLERFRSEGDELVDAMQKTIALLEGGTFALVVVDAQQPGEMVAACMGSPLYLGIASDGLFIASDHRAFRAHTNQYITLADGQMVIVDAQQRFRVVTFTNQPIDHKIQELKYQLEDIEKNGFGTFMEKEIHEQPGVIEHVLEGRATEDGQIRLGGFETHPELVRFIREEMKKIILLGCGTSLFAGEAVTRFLQEQGYDVEAIDAAEFATSLRRIKTDTLFIPISQSGTTADLLVAMEKVKAAGAVSFALVNVPGSRLTSYGPGLYLQAGPETGVASTKAFSAQILSGAILTLAMAQEGRLNAPHVKAFVERTQSLASAIRTILADSERIKKIANTLKDTPRMLYIGRGYGLPVAKEGALKMMEIACIPSLGMSAATIKHGPIALIDEAAVVVAICIPDPRVPELYDLTLSNVEQVLSRSGRVIVIAEAGDERVAQLGPPQKHPEHVIYVPCTSYGVTSAITAMIPLQLLALYTAEARGLNVDQPANLAKSVTVL